MRMKHRLNHILSSTNLWLITYFGPKLYWNKTEGSMNKSTNSQTKTHTTKNFLLKNCSMEI